MFQECFTKLNDVPPVAPPAIVSAAKSKASKSVPRELTRSFCPAEAPVFSIMSRSSPKRLLNDAIYYDAITAQEFATSPATILIISKLAELSLRTKDPGVAVAPKKVSDPDKVTVAKLVFAVVLSG